MANNKFFKRIITFIKHACTFCSELIYPPRCVICNKPYCKKNFDDTMYICASCGEKIRFISSSPHLCKKCSRPINEENILCNACQISQHYFDISFSCALYEKEMRSALLSYKFGTLRYKYRIFSQILYNHMMTISPFPNFDVICSVPSSKKRKKEKGFDHVLPFAKYISRKTNTPYDSKALYKIKETKPQSKLTFKERQLSVKGAYKVMKPEFIKGKYVLLIDDIYTTGATVSEISRILKRSGARYVAVFTLCITPEINIGDDFNS